MAHLALGAGLGADVKPETGLRTEGRSAHCAHGLPHLAFGAAGAQALTPGSSRMVQVNANPRDPRF